MAILQIIGGLIVAIILSSAIGIPIALWFVKRKNKKIEEEATKKYLSINEELGIKEKIVEKEVQNGTGQYRTKENSNREFRKHSERGEEQRNKVVRREPTVEEPAINFPGESESETDSIEQIGNELPDADNLLRD